MDIIAGRFELVEHVASGGMGSVFRGQDLERDAVVAVKLLRSNADLDIHRFGREADLIARLDHPGIVRYITHGATSDGRYYLVQEWLEGVTLANRLATDGLTADESVHMIERAARALATVHQLGIIHRDIKPENLFLEHGRHDAIKILDFGVARYQGRGQRLTSTGALVGSIGYMAPEQARGARDLSIRVDVFALGCVLYECLTGSAAFPGHNLLAIKSKILLTEPEELAVICPELPPRLHQLITTMLAKNPAERLDGAAQVADALASLGSLPTTARRRRFDSDPVTVIIPERPTDVAGLTCLVLTALAPGDDALPETAELLDALGSVAGQVERIDDTSLVLLLAPSSDPGQCITNGAHAALALRRLLPDASIVISCAAHLDPAHDGPGAAIDRGAATLDGAGVGALFTGPINATASAPSPIALDPVSARFLAHGFAVEQTARGWVLIPEPSASQQPARALDATRPD